MAQRSKVHLILLVCLTLPAAQEHGTELLLISVCYNWEELPDLLMSVKKMDKIGRVEEERRRS